MLQNIGERVKMAGGNGSELEGATALPQNSSLERREGRLQIFWQSPRKKNTRPTSSLAIGVHLLSNQLQNWSETKQVVVFELCLDQLVAIMHKLLLSRTG